MKFPKCHHYRGYYCELADFDGSFTVATHRKVSMYLTNDGTMKDYRFYSERKIFRNETAAHKAIDKRISKA
jgi:hypothetical protein